jgi:hypothetical protein
MRYGIGMPITQQYRQDATHPHPSLSGRGF